MAKKKSVLDDPTLDALDPEVVEDTETAPAITVEEIVVENRSTLVTRSHTFSAPVQEPEKIPDPPAPPKKTVVAAPVVTTPVPVPTPPKTHSKKIRDRIRTRNGMGTITHIYPNDTARVVLDYYHTSIVVPLR
jgi:hypothetical protein